MVHHQQPPCFRSLNSCSINAFLLLDVLIRLGTSFLVQLAMHWAIIDKFHSQNVISITL